jgi:hypothetical protein
MRSIAGFPAAENKSLSAPSRRKRHGVNHKDNRVGTSQEYHPDQPSTHPAALDEPFVVADFSWKASARAVDHRFDLLNRASVFCSVINIPIVPPEALHRSDTTKRRNWVNYKV